MHKPYQFCLSVIAISCLSLPYVNASSNFTILPAANHTLPTTISPGQTVSAYYTVLNNTGSTRSGYLVTGLHSDIHQNTTGLGSCSNPISLAAYGNCTLQLDIRSPVQSNFALCKGTSCTASMVPLNIVKQSASAQGEKLRVAVGTYEQTNGGSFPLVYTSADSGLTWNQNTTELPLPTGAAIGSEAVATLASVACDKATKLRCTAVGTYQSDKGETYPLIYNSLNGGNSWSLNTNIKPGNSGNTTLASISCDSAQLKCNVVGHYINLNEGTLPMRYASIDGGNSWSSRLSMPLPADAQTLPADAKITSNYCSGLQCRAVGSYTNTSGGIAALIYTSANAGASWTVRSAPTPSDALQGSDMKIEPSGVACDNTSGLHCIAVGQYKTAAGFVPLVYTTINGGVTWNTSSLPLPADYSGENEGFPILAGVTCDNSGLKCISVGSYKTTQSAPPSALSYTSTNGGTSWTLGTVLPSTSVLMGVVCDSETNIICSAVGGGLISNDDFGPVIYKSSNGGSTWNTVPITLPPLGGDDPSTFLSVK